MKRSHEQAIFESGSTTYYFSSKFFASGVRDDVFKLYSFVRVVDNFVDDVPQDKTSFNKVVRRWRHAKKNLSEFKRVDDSLIERVLGNIVYVVHRYSCDPQWIDDFLKSMNMDLVGRTYNTVDDMLEYIYGSAEVIGLCMSKILSLPEEALPYAQSQGRAMQLINFIRDIAEDNELGRCYFPKEELTMFGLKNLSEHEARKKPAEFREFIQYQVARYEQWQAEANKGFRFIPKRSRIAVRTAVDMYNWTAKVIADEPLIVFDRKVKPGKRKVLRTGLKRVLYG